jgi:tetrahydrodipicolinate N-succinyltransferase
MPLSPPELTASASEPAMTEVTVLAAVGARCHLGLGVGRLLGLSGLAHDAPPDDIRLNDFG